MNSGLLRNLCGISLGLFISVVLAILTVNVVPHYVSEYVPILIGAFVASSIVRNNPVVVGGILSFLMMGISILNLMLISFSTAKSMNIAGLLNSKIIISLFLYLPFGLLGGYCVHILKRRKSQDSITHQKRGKLGT